MAENELKSTQELSDEELEGVAGGKWFTEENGKYYEYTGSRSDADWSASYLCPKCGKPLHYGSWGRYYCDPCDESWFFESPLKLNLQSGVWTEITKERYDYLTSVSDTAL